MSTESSAVDLGKPLEDMTHQELELWGIRNALRITAGNVSHAAKRLGISRDKVHRSVKEMESLGVLIYDSSNNSDCEPS